MKKLTKHLLVAGAVLSFGCFAPKILAEQTTVPVQVLGVNDFHGALSTTGSYYYPGGKISGAGGAALLSSKLNQMQANFVANHPTGQTLRVSAGDMVGASPANSGLLQDEPTIKAFNAMNFTVGTIGNHEFDEGLAEFNRILLGQAPSADSNFLDIVKSYPREASKMDLVIANLVNKSDGKIPFGWHPYTVKTLTDANGNSVKVGFIGVVTTEIPDLVLRKNWQDYQFLDEAETIAKYEKELRENQKVNAIVVLAHVPSVQSGETTTGAVADMLAKLATIDPNHTVDAVFAGHNHVYTNGVNGKTRVMQSTSQGKGVAEITGEIDVATQDFVKVPDGQVVPVTKENLTPDEKVAVIVADADNRIADERNKVIGAVDADTMVTREVNDNVQRESPLGNLITDGQRAMAKEAGYDVDFAMTNNGGIRADLLLGKDGMVTWGAAQAVQPFGNILQVVEMTGAQIKEVLEQQYDDEKYFLQISGLSYTFTENPTGDANQKYVVESMTKEDGNPITPEGKYKVVINDFLFGGGDGFKGFTNTKLLGAIDPDTETFVNYIQKSSAKGKMAVPALDRKLLYQERVAKVGEIQGNDHLGAFTHQNVTVKDVVVTAVENSSRFYVQDLHPDGDITTSDGMSVYFKNHNVKVGDQLELKGTVAEVFGAGYAEKEQTDLTITQLQATQVMKVGTAQVPAPVVLGVDRKVPSQHIENDGFVNFDPNDDALDFWESLEGMLVAVNNAKILGPQKNGELFVLPGESTDILNHSGGLLLDEDFNPQIIALSTGDRKLRAKAKDTIEGQVAGPVTYSYSMYKVYLPKNSVKIKDGKLAREKTTIKASKDKLTIASYNIENFSANKASTSDEKVQRIAQSFVNDLNAPDIITLLEMQDNNGPIDDGNTDATQSAKRLIEAIEKAGGPSYQYVDVAPENNQDGGAPGANIRVGFLYNPKRVDYNKSEAIGKGNELFKDTRKSLAGYFTFKENEQKILLIGNHLNSKRGDQPLYGSHQPASFASAMKRDQLAQTIYTYVEKAVKSDPSLKVVMTGDFNDFEFSNTLAILEGKQLVNLVKTHPAEDRYSYFYQGNSETLDHILVSKDLAKNAVFDMIHINAMFMQEDGRASDHDPVMVQLTFKKQNSGAGEKDKDKGDSTDNQDKKNNNGKLPKKLKKDLPAAGTKIMGSLVIIGVVLIGAAIIIRIYNTKKAK